MPNFDLTIDGVVEHIRQLPYNEIVKIAYILCETIDGAKNEKEKQTEKEN